jgi:catechol 2,3-dioxygenase-like lactoylglutathione lyase family enzyme
MMATATERFRLRTTGIHHATLRSSDLARARIFYVERLGFTLLKDGPDHFTFVAGESPIRVLGPSEREGADETRDLGRRGAGVDRIALACASAAELRRTAAALMAAGIEHSVVLVDAELGKEYMTFDDPDGIGWELYVV